MASPSIAPPNDCHADQPLWVSWRHHSAPSVARENSFIPTPLGTSWPKTLRVLPGSAPGGMTGSEPGVGPVAGTVVGPVVGTVVEGTVLGAVVVDGAEDSGGPDAGARNVGVEQTVG